MVWSACVHGTSCLCTLSASVFIEPSLHQLVYSISGSAKHHETMQSRQCMQCRMPATIPVVQLSLYVQYSEGAWMLCAQCICSLKLYSYCKVAGSNLTCRDDWKTRWRIHLVDPTSTALSSLGQNIIH